MHINVNKVKLGDNLFSMKILLVKYWVMNKHVQPSWKATTVHGGRC